MADKKCAYLTMRDPGDFVMDYDLSFDAMAAHGWEVDTVPWRNPDIDWDEYDAVYLCTAWDYPDHFDEFIAVLNKIEDSSAMLVNERALVNWNTRKTYLRDLEAGGADIVPSLWSTSIDATDIPGWFRAHGTETVVIKPEIGANAHDTFVLHNPVDGDTQALLLAAFSNRAFLVQPFIENIRTEGEFSLFYFGGDYSHAVLKTPVDGEYRSQEEYGSQIQSVEAEDALLAAGDKVVALMRPQPVYVRVDLIRGPDGRFLVMELELIEPSLYLRTDEKAAGRFAAAFDKHYSNLRSA
jgi:glutathione synthase/RimK-type ligase-like ATP-grasp enzyme